MTRYEQCCKVVERHADVLLDRIKRKEIHESSFEGLMIGYIGQPGFDVIWRADLLKHILSYAAFMVVVDRIPAIWTCCECGKEFDNSPGGVMPTGQKTVAQGTGQRPKVVGDICGECI